MPTSLRFSQSGWTIWPLICVNIVGIIDSSLGWSMDELWEVPRVIGIMTGMMQMALSVSKCSASELLSVKLSGAELEERRHMHTSRTNLHALHLLQRFLPLILEMGSSTLEVSDRYLEARISEKTFLTIFWFRLHYAIWMFNRPLDILSASSFLFPGMWAALSQILTYWYQGNQTKYIHAVIKFKILRYLCAFYPCWSLE